ncbi:MAG: site-specific integrase [Lachnospiraceae bacterium]|nr:site-specific integrase [Lachnospiraceae bacterium]
MATIQKRNNGYFISVSCGYDVNGKQIRRTMTYKPEKGMTAKQIEKEVQRQAVLFEEQCNKGTVSADNRLKLADYIPMYLENAKSTLSPVVYEQYNRIFNIYVIPMLGHFKLKDIKPLHVQKFVNALENLEERTDGTPCKLSPSTVRRYYTALQSVLHSAYKLGIIGNNPADSDRITLPKLTEQETDIFTTEDLNNMLFCLDGGPLQFQLLIHLALNTGCRRGELTGLKWSDIDYSTGIITVSRSNYKLTGDTEIKSKSTKTGKSRKVMIPPYCIDMLRKYKAQQAELQLSLGDRWNGDNWIFIQADGKPMYPTTPTLQFTKFLKRNNLPHMKFHALRHTSATLLLSNGTNIKNVAARLGHAQLKTTNRYVHAVEEAEKEAANTLETLLNTNRKGA